LPVRRPAHSAERSRWGTCTEDGGWPDPTVGCGSQPEWSTARSTPVSAVCIHGEKPWFASSV